ncbi:MAG: quinone oxidoreductase [Actinobacteria bacterium]|nr:quinone oxidoreductase [Actinomycetota bacterium]
MKIIRVHQLGGPEAMLLEEAPVPEPGPGQVLVKIEAIGVNFIDIYNRSGLYKNPLPVTPGNEGAGTVEAVGSGVAEVKTGDRVAWGMNIGSYAQYRVISSDRLVTIPAGLSFQDAASVMLQGMTAHYLAISTYPLKAGDSCLIHAAAGGLGQLLCQVAKIRGARVIGTVGSPAKAEIARQAGADEVILYRDQDFVARTRELTGGAGVQVVYDTVGKDTFAGSLDSLARRGMLVLVGQASGPVPPLDPGVLNVKGSLYLTRPSLNAYVATRDELLWRAGEVLGWVASGKLRQKIDRTYPLAEAAAAHEALSSRETAGKLLLIP